MPYYIIVVICAALFSAGIVRLKKPFFALALTTTALLDTMLDRQRSAEEKQRDMIARLGRMLFRFGAFLFWFSVVIAVSLAPFYLFLIVQQRQFEDVDTHSWRFFGAMLIGSLVFLYPALGAKKSDYSDWSIILHKIVLDNVHISRALFSMEKRLYRKRLRSEGDQWIVVTGLARAGTTALTNQLYGSGQFHSLTYRNMPFLLAVNLWRKLYRPDLAKEKERAHGDKIRIGYDSVEALEEYFFKVFLNDCYIGEKSLVSHEVDDETYREYLNYQNLIRGKSHSTRYLAKNNNFMLRYKSMRGFNHDIKVLLLFRSPYEHASSLLRQHVNFEQRQKRDPFVLEYMNWLGHHEFGLNHKPFVFDDDAPDNPTAVEHSRSTVDYWLNLWIHYYRFALSCNDDSNLIYVKYEDFLKRPRDLLRALGSAIDVDFSSIEAAPFQPRSYKQSPVDSELLVKANELYNKLCDRSILAKLR